jgi:heptosyltransferase-2
MDSGLMKILVTDTMHIGDILFATPFLRALRRAYADADITMMVTEECADVIRFNPNINHLLLINKKNHHSNFLNIFTKCRSLLRDNYDMVINLHAVEWASIIALFSTNKVRIGFSAPLFRSFFNLPVTPRYDIHSVKKYCGIITALGKEEFLDDAGLDMYIDNFTNRKVDELWSSLNIPVDRKIIGLNPGGTWTTKKWSAAGFARLIEIIDSEGMVPVLFGGKADAVIVDDILRHTDIKPVVLTGKLSLLELASALRHCMVLATNDSGPMHIAASQGVPVAAIFGPSDSRRYAPYGVKNIIIKSDYDCIPCNKRECVTTHCMTSIIPEKIFTAIQLLLHE